jgi:putative chitinase
MMSTELAVLRIAPKAGPFAQPVENACIRYGIVTPIHKAHFLAQLAHESCGFTVLTENLNYSAKGLLATFPKYFGATTAASYARKPVAIANRVYANRLGNGAEASGDGWLYRGRGPIQCTGKDNYRAFSLSYFGDERLVRAPDLLLNPVIGCMFAGWFWQQRNINAVVDEDDILNLFAENDDIRSVTRKVNGGTNGLDDRMRWLRLAKESLWVSRSA